MGEVKAKFERILDQIVKSEDLILSAHEELGLPLSDLICAAVRRAVELRVVDARQSEFPLRADPASPVEMVHRPHVLLEIKKAMRESGKSRLEIARETGVSYGTIKAIQRGDTQIRDDTVVKLARVLCVETSSGGSR